MNVKINNKLKKYWFNFILFLVFSDQLSKLLVQYFIQIKTSVKIIPDLLFFTHITNDGISFGWNPFSNSMLLFFISLLACIFIIKVLLDSHDETSLNQKSLCFIIGGAIGNLYDRIIYKAVPDFIDFHIKDFHWFTFNIADIFISLGIILMILNELIYNREKK